MMTIADNGRLPQKTEEAPAMGTIDVDRIDGQVKDSLARKIGNLVENHPGEALSVIRKWMSANK